MTKFNEPVTSVEFEQQIARIIEVLKDEGAKVTWDDKIPDPDNLAQSRQIDITIRRDDLLTIVECRLHNRPQDVKWIEELYGRRVSLNAQGVIGVSSSGFTTGAIAKANRLGVVLRHLRSLTNDELASWGRGTRVWLEYIQFGRSTMYVITDLSSGSGIITTKLVRTSKGDSWPVAELFKGLSRKLRDADFDKGGVCFQVFPKDLYVRGVLVEEIVVRCEWQKVKRQIVLPIVYIYRPPSTGSDVGGSSFIEKALVSDTEIYHVDKGVLPVVDLSIIEAIDHGYFQGILLDFGQPLPVTGFALLGEVPENLVVVRSALRFVRKGSAKYESLFTLGPQTLVFPA
jgi:hypothetical protein